MYHFIINPASSSGNGIKIWQEVEKILIEKNIEYDSHLTSSSLDALNYAKELTSASKDLDNSYSVNTSNSPDTGNLLDNSKESSNKIKTGNGKESHLNTIVIIGGDGTVNAVVRGIEDYSKVTLGYIPAGSSNDLARDLKIPTNTLEAINAVLAPKEYTLMDICELEYELTREDNSLDYDFSSQEKEGKSNFNVSCGIGYDAAICLEANKSKLKEILNKLHLGKLVYVIIALKQLAATKKCSCVITLDDKREIKIDSFFFVATMIHKFEGGGFMFCPDANYKDQILNICTVGDIAKHMVLRILPTAYNGKHVKFKGINTYTAKKVSITTDRPCALHTDGEVLGLYDKITITQNEKQLRIIIR